MLWFPLTLQMAHTFSLRHRLPKPTQSTCNPLLPEGGSAACLQLGGGVGVDGLGQPILLLLPHPQGVSLPLRPLLQPLRRLPVQRV